MQITILLLLIIIGSSSLYLVLLTRISAIVFIYAGVLSFNALDIQSIGSGIGIFSGLLHATTVPEPFVRSCIFIFFIGAFILISFIINRSNKTTYSYPLLGLGGTSVLASRLSASLLVLS